MHLSAGDWIAVAAVVLGLMALPTVFQMIWGRPKIGFRFEEFTQQGKRVLGCRLFNKPVTNPLLVFFRVRRESAHVSGAFTVCDAATSERVASVTQPIIVSHRGRSREAELPASPITSANIGFVYA